MLKPIDNQTTCSVVWPMDPAVDIESSDVEGYSKVIATQPGKWRDYLKFKDGHQPTEFIIGVIPSHLMVRFEDEFGTSKSLQWSSFLYGLRDIKNPGGLVTEYTDKKTGQVRREVPKVTVNDVEYVDPTWLTKVMVMKLRQAALWVGQVAYVWNQLGDTDLKNS